MGYPFRSLRDWMEFLESKGDLIQNNEPVGVEGEISAISSRIAKDDGPAIIHNNIEDYAGWRVFSDGITTRRRQLWAVDLDSPLGAVKIMADKLAKAEAIKPDLVDDGPCKEVKILGDDIDLTKFPITYTGEYELAPHITAGISNIKDPDTGWTNSGIRRYQIMSKNEICNLVLPYQHEGAIFLKYKQQNKPMPISIVLGADPISYFSCMMPAPDQFDEMDYWAGLSGEHLKVVKSETNDILVPASAEIVIEGVIDPVERKLEGPFPEFPGYYSGFRMATVVKVTAITMRKDAIFQHMYMGVPPSEGHNAGAFVYEAELYSQINQLAPYVTDVGILSTWAMSAAIAVDKQARLRTPGLEQKVALAAKSVKAGGLLKNIFIVDDDVDVHNIHEVMWSFTVKFQAEKDIYVLKDMPGLIVDPSEAVIGPGYTSVGRTSVGIYNCTEKAPPYHEGFKRGLATPPKKATEKVNRNLTKYGFK